MINGGQKSAAHPTFDGFCYNQSLSYDCILLCHVNGGADIPGATYFFTVVTYRRRPILCDVPVRAALRYAVKTVHASPFTIDAWVKLPTVWDRNTIPRGHKKKQEISRFCLALSSLR
jgi:hypothetical protein